MALGCGITKAGPDHPIYKNGWTIGGASSTLSPKSETPETTDEQTNKDTPEPDVNHGQDKG